MRGLRRFWTSRAVVNCLTIPLVCAAALLVACDSDRELTAPSGPMSGGGNSAEVGGGLQADLGVISDVPDWAGSLLFGATMLEANAANTQEELPGMGHKFELRFAMIDDQDPQNPTNDVISLLALSPPTRGSAVRNFPPGIKITALDHQINLKYFFPDRTCANGGPRIQLAIDGNGDGKFDQFPGGPDQNAFGYVGHLPFGAGCITGEWDIIDMTDNIGRWDLAQLPGMFAGNKMTMTWDQAELFITGAFPNHKVLSGALVDDGCAGGGPTACGQAYYDLVTLENRTLENDQDTVH